MIDTARMKMAILKPYPVCRSSGIAELGEIPAHWDQRPLYAITSVKNERDRSDLPLLSVYRDYGVIPRDSREDNYNPKGSDLSTYKAVSPGDLVLNKMKTWQGSLGVSPYQGIVSPAYIVCRLSGSVDGRYLHHLLRSRPYVNHYNRLSFGVRVNQWDMRYDDFKRVQVFLPPLQEQRAIARFLDHHDRLTRRYIRAQRRLIALLEEQKQALIQRAVTRGLDPGVRLKASGVEWIEDISMHWELKRLKYVADFNPPKSESSHLCDPGAIASFLPMENVSVDGKVDYSEHRLVSDVWQGYTYFRRGDVVVAKITPCFENGKGACLDEMPTDIGFGTTEFVVLRSLGQVSPRYLYYFTQCERFRQLGAEAMTGAAGQQRVPVEFMRNFWMPIPPRNEQTAILDYLDTALPRIDASIAGTQRQIDLVREYRTRLIADVVTGKLDVRGVALPEIEPDEIDDLEDETPFDENHEEDAADAENGYE